MPPNVCGQDSVPPPVAGPVVRPNPSPVSASPTGTPAPTTTVPTAAATTANRRRRAADPRSHLLEPVAWIGQLGRKHAQPPHDVLAHLDSSTSTPAPSAARSFASPFAAWLFTVPVEQPSRTPTSCSGRSS